MCVVERGGEAKWGTGMVPSVNLVELFRYANERAQQALPLLLLTLTNANLYICKDFKYPVFVISVSIGSY